MRWDEEGEEWSKLYENLEQLSGEHHNQPLVFQHTAFQDAESVLHLWISFFNRMLRSSDQSKTTSLDNEIHWGSAFNELASWRVGVAVVYISTQMHSTDFTTCIYTLALNEKSCGIGLINSKQGRWNSRGYEIAPFLNMQTIYLFYYKIIIKE